jgi:hypothetical protein
MDSGQNMKPELINKAPNKMFWWYRQQTDDTTRNQNKFIGHQIKCFGGMDSRQMTQHETRTNSSDTK